MWGGAAVILLLPLILGAPWTGSDYVIMGAMLSIAGGIVELAMRASDLIAYRLGAIIAVGTGFLLVWMNLAVGIIGSEDNPVNLIYAGVVGLALIGSFAAWFKPGGMARALFLTAAAQMIVTIAALIWGWGRWEPPGAAGILVLNGFFAGLWFLSGSLFRRAANARAPA
jgi:hypothetical protein